ncbi:UNVERIFIED_CONTAM: hypothetical protein FKN15_004140 [Acipenser sinensis]
MTQGEAVHQLPSIHLTKNEKRILFCQYETSGSPDLFWYIQEHNKAPERLLNENLNDNPRFKERFSASHDKRLSYGDEVRPWKDLQTSEETQETKIYCNYSLSNNAYTEYLFWYQQTPGWNPRYILHRYKASGGSKELRSEESDRSELDVTFLKMYLYVGLLLSIAFCISSGDQISQKEASVLKTEEETATLECTFSTSSTRYWLHWYRQYPGTAPQFILFSGSGSFTADYAKERFSSTADKSSGLTTFTISRVLLEDSAVYYCALQHTVIQYWGHSYKNLLCAQSTEHLFLYCL